MKKDHVERDACSIGGMSLFGMALIALLAHLASTELHECFHLIAGRLAGLPSHFLSLTSVGVDSSVAENARPSALALMNGVAPLATMLLGVLALVVLPALRRRAPAAVTAFVAWCAIFAIPYIGLQLMTTAAPIRLRGDGADSAAVIGGYFAAPIVLRAAISLAGLLLFMASGFWLGAAVSENCSDEPSHVTLRQHLRGLATWRLAAASVLGLLLIVMTVRSAALLVHGNGGGLFSLLLETWVWAAMMTLLVPWRAPGARDVRDHWIFPGLLASAAMLAISLLTHLFDFFLDATLFVVPLIATAWVLAGASRTPDRDDVLARP